MLGGSAWQSSEWWWVCGSLSSSYISITFNQAVSSPWLMLRCFGSGPSSGGERDYRGTAEPFAWWWDGCVRQMPAYTGQLCMWEPAQYPWAASRFLWSTPFKVCSVCGPLSRSSMSPFVMHSRNVFFLNNRVDVFSPSLSVKVSLFIYFFSSQHGIIDALE